VEIKGEMVFDGYYTILPFDDEQVNHLAWFVRMKNLDRYLWMKTCLQ